MLSVILSGHPGPDNRHIDIFEICLEMYWYEDDIKRLEKERTELTYNPETTFYGSSSIRLWPDFYEQFKALKPVNIGFGGSTLAACTWFFERALAPYNPKRILIYAGDNDLGDGRNPEEVFIFFQQLAVKIGQRFGNIPCYFISVKPSLSRWNMIDSIKYTNNLVEGEIIKQDKNWRFINIYSKMVDATGHPVKEYFESDGLHLSRAGYDVWKKIILDTLSLTLA